MDNEDAKLRTIRLFLSYSHKDRELAGEIKENLQDCGFEVFLAHEDIEPSSEWLEEIIRRLKDCDVFIPIISKNFKESNWTDQESGIAFAEEKMIIPLRLDLVPYGFIGKFQALKLSGSISDTCTKIIDIIKIKNKALKEIITDNFIKSFINSESFAEANRKAQLLSSHEPLTDEQINEIVRGFVTNSQVYGAFTSKRIVKKFYEEHSSY